MTAATLSGRFFGQGPVHPETIGDGKQFLVGAAGSLQTGCRGRYLLIGADKQLVPMGAGRVDLGSRQLLLLGRRERDETNRRSL